MSIVDFFLKGIKEIEKRAKLTGNPEEDAKTLAGSKEQTPVPAPKASSTPKTTQKPKASPTPKVKPTPKAQPEITPPSNQTDTPEPPYPEDTQSEPASKITGEPANLDKNSPLDRALKNALGRTNNTQDPLLADDDDNDTEDLADDLFAIGSEEEVEDEDDLD